MTVLDTSRKHWDTTPDRLIHTTRHRVAPTPGTGVRVDAAQRVQSSVYDVVAEHLVHHPCKLWMATGKSRSDSVLKWLTRERKTRPDWQSETVAVVRGAARDAFEATRRWDEHQHELARSVLREQDAEDAIRNGKAPHPNEIQDDEERRKHEPSPRLVRRWTKEPCTTGRREERTAALRLLEPPKVVDATTVRLPGIGDLELQDPVPDGADVRSCQVVESTREGTPPDKKRYRVHLQIGTPVPKTRRRRAVGIDLGVVHAITTSDGEFLDRPDVSALLEEARRLVDSARKHCTRDSRAWRQRQAQARELRRKARQVQDSWEWHAARKVACLGGLLGMESLKLRNMTASGRGTSSAPGSNAKHGLNAALALGRLGALAGKVLRQALKAGTHLVLVHPGNTSLTCNQCKHRDGKSRLAQALFQCTSCGYEENADKNASRNIRDRAVSCWTGYRQRRTRGTRVRARKGEGEAPGAAGNGGGEPLRAAPAPNGESPRRHTMTPATGPPGASVESSI